MTIGTQRKEAATPSVPMLRRGQTRSTPFVLPVLQVVQSHPPLMPGQSIVLKASTAGA